MSEHTPLTGAERKSLSNVLADYAYGHHDEKIYAEVNRILAARTSTATADTGLRERVEGLLLCGESAGLRHYYAIDGTCQRCGLPSHVETQFRAALDATAAPTADTGARDE